jgi:predicted dehydrogenase
MNEERLKIALLGLGQDGRLLLEAAGLAGCFDIEAVADPDAALTERIAAQLKCLPFDDYRQLVTAMDSKLSRCHRVLMVAADMHTCDEHIRLAIKKKFDIIKLAPAARDFEEAANFAKLAEDEGVRFVIANPSRYIESFMALKHFLDKGSIEQIFLINAFCSFGPNPYPLWQNDPKLAGGGVLLYNCYRMIDQIVLNFGVPMQVYCLKTNQANDKRQRSYLTEDTAVVTMKFSDSFIASLIASRRSGTGPAQELLTIYGKDCIASVTRTQMMVTDGSGNILQQSQYEDNRFNGMVELLKQFALVVLSPDNNKLSSTAMENLKDMAVLEAAYLSSRTGFPEEPARILKMPSSTPINS